MEFEKECEKLCINRNDIREENIQRNYIIEFLVKCMIKLNKINIISLYVFILNISFFIQFVECNHRKIELFSSYINLKTIGTGQIRVFSSYYDKNNYPTAIIINNRINHTNSEINNEYYLDNEENNITLIWDEPPTTTTKMFQYCKNIIEIDLSNFKTNNVTTMEGMFSWCTSLISINLSNYDGSSVTTVEEMFYECSSLIYLDLSNFITSNVKSMRSMFEGCASLISLKISDFDTSSVTTMDKMFYRCSSLISVDLSSFNIGNVLTMRNIFDGCSSLISLDLSNFDTSKVTIMTDMFSWCSSLISLNLSNFDTSNVTMMEGIFYNCKLLVFLDLSNFNTRNVSMFNGCSSLKYLDLTHFDTSSVTNMNDMFYGCNSLISLNISNIDTRNVSSMTSMFEKCSSLESLFIKNFNTANVDTINFMFKDCSALISLDLSNFNTSSIKNMKYMLQNCSSLKYLDLSNFNILHVQNMACVLSNCTSLEYINLKNAKINLDKLFSKECFIPPKNLSICNLDDDFQIGLNNITHLETNTIIEKEPEVKNRTELIQNMINNLLNRIDISDIDGGKDEKTDEYDITIIMTSTKNQKKNENKNIIIIDLCNCENILKNEYNISKNDSLYILQMIYEEKGMKIPKVEYEVYFPIYINNLTKLNLTLCKGTKVEISIPVKINDNLNKHNPKSGYYNDICYKATSECKTDINLKDRRNEFVENNMTLCEEKCDLINYNYTNEKVKCSCEVKTNIRPNYDTKFNKKEFFKSFTDIKNIANISIMKCYKIVLNFKNLINNYGFYIIGFIFLLYIITIFIFCFFSYKKLKDNLLSMVIFINKSQSIEIQPMIKENENENIIKNKIKKRKKKKKRKKPKNINIENNLEINNNKIKYLNNTKQTSQNNQDKSSNMLNILEILKFKSDDLNMKYAKEFLDQKDFEINSLEYEEAFKLDKRNFILYYISLLKNNHPLIFSFGCHNDYNFRIIKMFLFFFSFSSDLTLNALFFNDDTMHKIYKDRGKYDLLFQIPQILYSTLISRFIDTLIKNFALTQDDIVEFKQEKEKEKNNYMEKYNKTINKIRIKIISFFVFAFIFLSFFWYYITCFCGIYVNTQIILIKDSVISLLTSLFFLLEYI